MPPSAACRPFSKQTAYVNNMTEQSRTSGAPAHAGASTNVVWHPGHVGTAERETLTRQHGCVLWFTGLSGSGKSTIARALEAELIGHGHLAYVLDGDNIRHGLNADLDFSPAGRAENIRRIAEVAALFADAGMIAITAFISPYRADRERARAVVARASAAAPRGVAPAAPVCPRFVEVFVDTPLAVCESRDPKGLYAKARAGTIADFTGVSAPYEAPLTPEIALGGPNQSVADAVTTVLTALNRFSILSPLIAPV